MMLFYLYEVTKMMKPIDLIGFAVGDAEAAKAADAFEALGTKVALFTYPLKLEGATE